MRRSLTHWDKMVLYMYLNSLLIVCLFIGVFGDTSCPRGWIANDGSCYLFAHYPQPYNEAKSFCSQHNGYLVEIHGIGENDFIKKHLQQLNTHHWWLGVTDEATEGVWLWGTDNVLSNYTDWYKGQPNGGIKENCAIYAYNTGYQWADVACTRTDTTPICEKSGDTCVTVVDIIG